MATKPQILVVAAIPPELRARLSKNYDLVDQRPTPGQTLPGFDVAVTTSMAGADAALMAALPDLQLIACNGAGLEKIDMEAAAQAGIAVRHTPDAVTDDTADFAIALMYATTRRVAEADRFVRSGRWKIERMTPSRRLFSRTVGIVGLGKIGSTVARRAQGLGMAVRYTGPREKPDVPYEYDDSVLKLARAVDILVLCCPGGPATDGLVGRDVLEALGKDGILINISRGSVVEQAALIDALQHATIAGAGLDVFDNEPDIDPRLMDCENVVLQPHYAAVTGETRQAIADVLEAAIDGHFAAIGSAHATT